MNKNEYNVSIENGMRVKHDALGRITVKSDKEVLEDSLHNAEYLGGAFTTISFMYNRASYSGGIDWWDPTTGRRISRPKIMVRFRQEDILTGDEECDCDRCLEETRILQ